MERHLSLVEKRRESVHDGNDCVDKGNQEINGSVSKKVLCELQKV